MKHRTVAASDVPAILCQPDATKSCGACCGMYNHTDFEAAATHARLLARTRAFRRDARIDDASSLRAFRREWETTEPDQKLLAELPNCPFLGYLDAHGGEPSGRVGCLVHPAQNDGVDGRDCGVYDRFVCEEYLCAAHQLLRSIEKWLVIEACSSSYVYGLVVTDVRFVRELFERTADANGAMPTFELVVRPPAIAAAARYFDLKRKWPYRGADGIFGQLEAGDGLETPRRPGPSRQLGLEPDTWESILRCLGTEVESVDQLRHAREIVSRRVLAFARAVAQ